MAMNIPLQQQQQQDQQQDQSLLVKQEPQLKQEPVQLSTPQYHQQQPQQHQHFQSMSSYSSQQQQQQPSNQSQHQTYGNFHGSSNSSMNSFSALPPNPYSLNSHLMGLSMHSGSSTPTSGGGLNSSSLAPTPTSSGMMGGNTSGSTTPSMAHASAPSSPRLSGLQYGYNQGGSSLYHQHPYQHQQHSSQHQYQSQQQPHQHSNLSSSNLTSSFYPASPPHQHQQQSYQSQHQSQQQAGSSTPSFNTLPPAPLRQTPQYAPLVPPLTDAQYAQYHQLLGSAFSSAASTPYHSNQSTPYSSMPTSPTLEYQQLSDPSLAQKPKRRQVKNACVNCQKACKKCDEGRPCTRCIKYGLSDTCVDSTRKVRKKGVKRGPYKRRPPPTQIGSASASTTPTLSHAVLAGGPVGYMSEPVTAMSSPTQSHMLPFTSSAMNQMSGPLDFGYTNTGSSTGYSFQTHTQRMDSNSNNNYAPTYTTSYSGSSLYANPYGMSDNGNIGNTGNGNNNLP
ncbi:hypothetical protein KI688_009285 [Linnemannia hyalina]|uniref:Zn(2)-C6 fungal-type domain-containing protein n=1 Tax=Linnemannia hyalina TaxID=64524 RepID=A0A9P8BYI2_9FUNG|nr:hypothetical protein KI688_009285 [Linnemannia hyalina]